MKMRILFVAAFVFFTTALEGVESVVRSVGLSLNVPRGVESRLLSSPVAHSSDSHDGKELYLPINLWRHAQTVALWQGNDIVIVLAQIEYKVPPLTTVPQSAPLLRRQWRKFNKAPDKGELNKWLLAFSGMPLAPGKVPPTDGKITWQRFNAAGGPMSTSVFYGQGNYRGEARRFVLLVGGANEQQCAELVRSVRLTWKEAGTPAAQRKGRTPAHTERLEQARRSIAGLKGWYILETANYIFVTNQTNRNDITRVQTDLESARSVFREYFPLPPDAKKNIGVVKIFNGRDEYLRYVGEAMKWSGGVWNPSVRELVVSPPSFEADARIKEIILRNVCLHEGFHQYIFYYCAETSAALWINEGCAQFFEYSFPRRRLIGDLPPGLEKHLAAAVARAPDDLARFIRLNHQEFYREGEREQNYALAHALVYYLLRGAPAHGENKYASIPSRYFNSLRRTRDLDLALTTAFTGVDTRMLAARLKAFWSNKKQIEKAKLHRGAYRPR